MSVLNPRGVLPGVQDVVDDDVDADAMFDLGEHKRTCAAHLTRITVHDAEICSHRCGQIGFVDHQKIGLRDSGTTFSRDFVTTCDIDDIHREIGEFAAEVGGQVVPARFDEEDVRVEKSVQLLECEQVCGDIFANGGVRAAAGFDRPNALCVECLMADQKFPVLSREDVVGDGGDADAFAKTFAEREHEGGFAAADRTAYADRERTLVKVAGDWLVTFMEITGVFHGFVRVAAAVRMCMCMIVSVRVRVGVMGGVHGVVVGWESALEKSGVQTVLSTLPHFEQRRRLCGVGDFEHGALGGGRGDGRRELRLKSLRVERAGNAESDGAGQHAADLLEEEPVNGDGAVEPDDVGQSAKDRSLMQELRLGWPSVSRCWLEHATC